MHNKVQSSQRILAGAVYFLLISWLHQVHSSNPRSDIKFDFIVIGWESDGLIVAKRLSENPNRKVLVLVPGSSSNTKEFLTVEETQKSFAHLLRWPRINDDREPEYYIRGVRQDYNSWLMKGLFGWGWKDLLRYFQKTVGNIVMPNNYVELKDFHFPNLTVNYEKFEKVILSNNTSSKPRLHFTAETGVGYFPKAEVKTIPGRFNYYLINGADRIRINFDASGEKVNNVSFVLGKRTITAQLKNELVLTAGAIESAKILMQSGIGHRNHLNSLNIPVLHDLPVGQNMKDHVAVPLFFAASVLDPEKSTVHMILPGMNDTFDRPFGKYGMLPLKEFYNTDSGDTSTNPDVEFNYFFIKQYDLAMFNHTWHNIFKLDLSVYTSLENILLTNNLIIVEAVLLHPKSTGRVELRSADITDMPRIFANYLDNEDDVNTLMKSISYMNNKLQLQNIWDINMFRPGFVISNPERLMDQGHDDAYWRYYIRHLLLPKLNPVGTVIMGHNKDDSCVNSRLLVHGVKNLRVADASIMPDITSGEIRAASMMIAEKAVDYIRWDWMFH